MTGAARTSVDSAGGLITSGSDNVFVDGSKLARVDDTIQSHGIGAHSSATIKTGSTGVFCNFKAVARQGDPATCGDVISSGSGDVIVGDASSKPVFISVTGNIIGDPLIDLMGILLDSSNIGPYNDPDDLWITNW